VARRREKPNQADETLHEIEESFDRLAKWVSEQRIALAIAVAAILAMALGLDLYGSHRTRLEEAGAAALAEARAEFLQAMGAQPGDLVVAEPANPEVARSARETFAKRFEEVGSKHAGTAAAALALLEAGNLYAQLGAPHLAQDAWQAGLESTDGDSALEALLLERTARAHEDAQEWSEAADAHERAGRVERFPARWTALAGAARCRIESGDADAALALFDEIEAAAALDEIPAYTAARLRELRAGRELRGAVNPTQG
jgi:predicted negative regulator of RcsB-dependent stress response